MGKKNYTRRKADKHILYEEAVQNPEFDAKFVRRLYKSIRGRKPADLKEDFCGTFSFACEWVKLDSDHRAIGVDLHKPTIKWGVKNNMSKLKDGQKKRIELKEANVLDVTKPQVDIVTAFNFSYFCFKTREQMRDYYRAAYESLRSDGLFIMDCFGGSQSYLEQEERRECDGFVYVWEHASYSPVTSDLKCKIHFEFKDGTEWKNAFVYEWRMWNLVDLTEILYDVGFKEVQIHWEGTDEKTGEGNGVFRKTKKGEACESWIAYIVGIK